MLESEDKQIPCNVTEKLSFVLRAMLAVVATIFTKHSIILERKLLLSKVKLALNKQSS